MISSKKLDEIKNEIRFNDVEFSYPSRKKNKVLKGINLVFEIGKKTALVGQTGCGKSSVIQLLERFYDIDKGNIQIDGTDIKEVNLQWWRDQIGFVGQEPVLFEGTIRDNLLIAKPTATLKEM